MEYEIKTGNCVEVMSKMDADSVDTIITSPPYWGLRDYGGDGQVWGSHLCTRDDDTYVSHEWDVYERPSENSRKNDNSLQLKSAYWEPQEQAFCKHCDAWFGQLGLEPTPEQYVKNMVQVFREARRILKPEGTLWLNLGDSYCAGTRKSTTPQTMHNGDARDVPLNRRNEASGYLKNKDLVGIPWRVAFALQEDGWWLRQDIIWAKPNCMPESVTDRCTKNHEYVFMFTKSAKYYFDNEAIKEPTKGGASSKKPAKEQTFRYGDDDSWAVEGDRSRIMKATGIAHARTKDYQKRNKRSVWWVSPKPFKQAHFAVFPIELIEPMVLAGTSAYGCCAECGAPWKRIVEGVATKAPSTGNHVNMTQTGGKGTERLNGSQKDYYTVGWRPTCECDADVVPSVVFDPFGGSGTTVVTALKNGRNAIIAELKEEYVEIAKERIEAFRREVGIDKTKVEWI